MDWRSGLGATIALALLLVVANARAEGTAPPAVFDNKADTQRAKELFKRAIAILDSQESNRDVAQAIQLLTAAAKSNHSGALKRLATIFLNGEGVAPDPKAAEAFLLQAVSTGEVKNANESLGDFYSGDNPLHDPMKAVASYQKSVDAGSVDAARKLAALVVKGDGIQIDLPRAERLLLLVAAADPKSGNERLGDLYRANGTLQNPAKAVAAYQKAAQAGSLGAMRKLAAMLLRADGVTPDPKRAKAILLKAIAAGDTNAGSETLGDLYRADTPLRDLNKATAAYRQSIAAGGIKAMVKLAGMLLRGEGTQPNPQEAEALLLKAASAGEIQSASEGLGDLYRADSPLRDPTKAISSYQQAVDVGSVSAAKKLSAMFLKGDGVAADAQRAEALLLRAIAGGDAKSGYESLGDLYRAHTPLKDFAKATTAYRQAVDAGSVGAMKKFAALLANGEGAPADPGGAETLLHQAIAAGDIQASNESLGDLYRGPSSLHDTAKAIAAYQRAATAGSIGAMKKLASMLTKGEGVAPDPKRAVKLLNAAITAGDVAGGALALGDLYRAKTPLLSKPKALAAYQQAAKVGNTTAMIRIARMYSSRKELRRDYPTMKKWLEQALAAGDVRNAALALGRLYARQDFPARSAAKSRAFFEQSAEAGNAGAHLELAHISALHYQDQSERDQMLQHYLSAAQTLSQDVVVEQIALLPHTALVAFVQGLLGQGGSKMTVDGVYGGQTRRAVGDYCVHHSVADCTPNAITKGLLTSLLFSPYP